MSINANWRMWATKSLYLHFSTALPGIHLPGTHVFGQEETGYELRLAGPDINELTGNECTITAVANILVRGSINDSDLYAYESMLNAAAAAFTGAVALYSFASNVKGAQFACMSLTFGRGQSDVAIRRAGQVSPAVKVLFGTVQGFYQAEINH